MSTEQVGGRELEAEIEGRLARGEVHSSEVDDLVSAALGAEKNLRVIHDANGEVEDAPRKMVEEAVPCTFDAWLNIHKALKRMAGRDVEPADPHQGGDRE